MFDYVSRKDYESERDARQRAEGQAEELRERVKFLEGLLSRFLPKGEVPQPTEAAFSEEMTPEQIMAIPATGRREVLLRQQRCDAAIKRGEENERKRRHDNLTPEEKQAVKETLVGAS